MILREAAADLHITIETAKTHAKSIRNKVGLHTMPAVVAHALRRGWIR